ncbi:hypothetical protein [Amycolatopsis sp. CA-126428]|uniref:hypothetical protein n=1 Tax=Amycolatopsis sp. CA-126428 TaxID=2073158 RepID=UPI0011B08471|nr:hypothetical protein [Amycolatopsis sp. CA-126428]
MNLRPKTGTPRLWFIAVLAAAAVVAAFCFAATGTDTRAGALSGALAALASTTAALTALHLSREALKRTDRQLAGARREMVLSRYPLLLPLHQSVSFPGSGGAISFHPPTAERFRLLPPELGNYAFVADNDNRFVVPIDNVGEGPALQVAGRLWRSDRAWGELVGPTALAAGRTAILTAQLSETGSELPAEFAAAAPDGPACCWLELDYFDVFGNPVTTRALFDPHGLGAWRHVTYPHGGSDSSGPG